MLQSLHIWNVLRTRVFKLLSARSFARWGRGTWIVAPVAVRGAANIMLGDDVYVASHSYLAASPPAGATECRLEIGDGCVIGHFNHIYATSRVVLGRKVLTANGVYISDNLHEYRDPTVAILDQPVRQVAEVRIGDGCWLGHNVVVVGASLGRNCVVGANSVVLGDLPDYCVAVGAPARIVRRFDVDRGEWRATAPDGSFQGSNDMEPER